MSIKIALSPELHNKIPLIPEYDVDEFPYQITLFLVSERTVGHQLISGSLNALYVASTDDAAVNILRVMDRHELEGVDNTALRTFLEDIQNANHG